MVMHEIKIVKLRRCGDNCTVVIPRDFAQHLEAEYLRAYLKGNKLVYEPLNCSGGERL